MVTTFFPDDPEPQAPDDELDLAVSPKLLSSIERFIRDHSGGDFGGISPPRERTQYKYSGKNIKKKGGNPPIDYHYVEEFVDLQIYVEQGDFEKALPIYYKLRRLIA